MRRALFVCAVLKLSTQSRPFNNEICSSTSNFDFAMKIYECNLTQMVYVALENILQELVLIFTSSTTHFVMFFYFGTLSFNETSVFCFFTEFLTLDWWNDLIFCRDIGIGVWQRKTRARFEIFKTENTWLLQNMNSTISYLKQSFEQEMSSNMFNGEIWNEKFFENHPHGLRAFIKHVED